MTTMVQHAVIEHNGKWPAPTNSDGFRYGQIGVMIWRGEFEVEAKRLGYINGYRWGIEYPTNGKRPELVDGTIVEARYPDGDWHEDGEDDVFDFLWKAFSHFRITDQRYRPADTCYLNIQPQDHIVEVNEMVDNSWHERGELPPVGAMAHLETVGFNVEIIDRETHNINSNGEPENHEVAIYKYKLGLGNLHVGYSRDASKFLPILTEREKVIEAAMLIANTCISTDQVVYALHKAGMLVLPPKKSDTKD